jgi:glycosyltransferase involved in cell wall biosynthesis
MPDSVEPLVSVLITAWNREAFIGHAIESVLASTITDIEIIVVDDASRDATADVAREYASRDSRVKVFVNEANLGDYPNRNRAASLARGRYIKYLDSDDSIYPHGLSVMVDCIDRFPSAALGLSAAPDPAAPFPLLLTPKQAYSEHFFVRDLLGRAPGSAIIRRSAFEEVGGFSGRRQVGDGELWLRIARRFPIVKMPSDLVWDREHASQEKHADNLLEKSIMYAEVHREALEADDCPLSSAERRAAREQLEQNMARHFWRLLRAGYGIQGARDYRRNAAIGWSAIAGAAVGIARSAGVFDEFSSRGPKG